MANIKFGTDGWRAIVGKDFNTENVEIVTNAIGKYVFDSFGLNKKILIGYDPRNMAKEFAYQCANLLVNSGFQVIISKEVIPTPVIAYGAKLFNACAIMFTASHNPPEYLGMKFIPDYAGPATDKITNDIVSNLGKNIPEKKGKLEKFCFKQPYFKHLQDIIDFDKINSLKTNIIFDGLYSATIGYFDEILKENSITFESFHMEHDPLFGGGMPEPKPKFLKELIAKVKSQPNSIGLANDGDGDRFGIINENGEYVSPNEIIAILFLYLKNNKKLNGPLIKTVSVSGFMDKLAEKFNTEIIETPVGFKYVGDAMRKNNAIIGGEESGGLSIQGHIPEKDGILANLLILEALGAKNKSLVELQKEIYEIVGNNFLNERIDLKLENQEQVRTTLEKMKTLDNINGYKILKINTKDGIKLFLDDNYSWILARPSGTEPLLRIYFESNNFSKLKTFKDFMLNL